MIGANTHLQEGFDLSQSANGGLQPRQRDDRTVRLCKIIVFICSYL